MKNKNKDLFQNKQHWPTAHMQASALMHN